MKKKRGIMFIIIGVIIITGVIVVGAIGLYLKKQMAKIPGMSFEDCLNYTLEGNKDGVISVGIIKDGEVTWNVYGEDGKILPAKLHTYEIGSLTKTMTAALTAKAISEGKIKQSDRIDQYLTLSKGNEYPTIEKLLTHTSGYKSFYLEKPMVGNFFAGRNSFDGITDEMVINRLNTLSMEKDAYEWNYSNFGFAVLGLILESVYDKEYTELVNSYLSDMGMENSHISDNSGDLNNYWDWKPKDAYLSAGGITSNMEDMLLYADAQLQEQDEFAMTHKKIKSVNMNTDSYLAMNIRIDAMGMAWVIDEENGIEWHNGGTSGYNSYLGFCRDSKTAVVVLANFAPNYKIPATVMGAKLLISLQK